MQTSQGKERELCVGLVLWGQRYLEVTPHSPSGMAQLLWEELVATGRYCCQCVSCPGLLQVLPVVSGKAAALEPRGPLLGHQDSSSRNFPFRHLFDDAWPTERRTASTSSSWPVTPTCCLTSESRSPRVALLELLLHQPLGHPITVLRIETHS